MISPEETPSRMIERMVDVLFSVEHRFGTSSAETARLQSEFGNLLDERLVVMSTPIMTNAGRYERRPLSACAVPPFADVASAQEIGSLVRRFHEDGMGTGFNFNGEENPVALLRYLNQLAVEGALSGREDRPVGNMGILSVYHPRILDFIRVKTGSDDQGESWKFNISIDVDDAFMEAVAQGRSYMLWNGVSLCARDVLKEIAIATHACGDPGLVFLKRLNRDNPTPGIGSYISTAPCGEVGLAPGEVCQFGYINIGAFLKREAGVRQVDYPRLEHAVRRMTRVLDNALEISMEQFPHPMNRTVMQAKRKIGIGVCGVADMFIRMHIPYASSRARQTLRDVVEFISFISKLESYELARRRGSFHAMAWRNGCRYTAKPNYLEERYGNLNGGGNGISGRMWRELGARVRDTKLLRNASTVALPPTGRSSLVISASAGIEPLFSLVNPDGTVNRDLEREVSDGAYNTGILDEVRVRGTVQDIPGLPPVWYERYATALEIEPIEHLRMVQCVQGVVDEAVAKTVNLPSGSTPRDIQNIYSLAYAFGLKGVTAFRTGSRTVQPRKVVS
jgi:ribonucleoside-diphosphate reductase alpha chain